MDTDTRQGRIAVFDTIKGVLVLSMLIHHAWSGSYVSGLDSVRSIFSFVSSAFILFSGIIFGYVLIQGYVQQPLDRMRKDIARGARLILIYLLFNAILYIVNYRSLQDNYDLVSWIGLCLQPGPPEAAVFSLLNAFAYFFIVSAAVFGLVNLISQNSKTGKYLTSLVFLIIIIASLVQGYDKNSLYYTAILYGFGGCILGIVFRDNKNLLGDIKTDWIGRIALLTFVILSIFSLVGIFDSYDYYFAYVILSCVVVWYLSKTPTGRIFVSRKLIHFWGKYSLVTYLVQVVVLQLVSLTLAHSLNAAMGPWLSFLLVLTGMALVQEFVIRSLELFRRQSLVLDKMYVQIFG